MSTNNSNNDLNLHALPDFIKEDLDMVVVGLNPSLTSAQIGHYFAGPGNHFWSCVSEVGLVSEPVTCYDDSRMLDYGIGFTNACTRATKGAADLSKKEMKDGMKSLLTKLQKYTPKIVVFNGKGTYEIFVRHKHFGMGKQPQRLEGTNSVVFVMPSSSARCAQLPRAADKIPFFSALKDLRDKIKIWSNGLSTGGRLVPLEETVNTSMFPDQIDLELTRLYDAGKSNYSTDRAEKKRKANSSNGGGQMNVKTSSSEDSSQGSAPGINRTQHLSKPPSYHRNKEDRLPTSVGSTFFMPNQAPSNGNGQWVTGAFYNSSFSYQQYLLDSSSSQYSSPMFCRYPSFRSNILPNSLPTSNSKSYSNTASARNSFSSAEERNDNTSFDRSSFSDTNSDGVQFSNHQASDSPNKTESINQKSDAKENFISQQASTNFVSLLMSDSPSVPGSPSEVDKPVESRFNQSSINWPNENCVPIDSVQYNPTNTFWEHNNNFLVNPLYGSRRSLPQDHPMASMFTSFQSNMTNFEEIPNDCRYQSPFTSSGFFSPPTSIVCAVNSMSSVHSPLSSDQVTSSLCSVKVTPDSTNHLANQKRPFTGPDLANIPNKMVMAADVGNHGSDHVSLTYTDL